MCVPTDPSDDGLGAEPAPEQEPEQEPITYHVCPRCLRATPREAGENFCPNDGTRMLSGCPKCGAAILTPFGEYCSSCGASLAGEPQLG